MLADPDARVAAAIEDLRSGRMVILTDDEDRENEGDLVFAAEKVTPALINFMATHARGLICLSLTGAQVDRLGLPPMASRNTSAWHTAFTVSVEAREGVSTGISAADRALTVAVASSPTATARDVVTPGHVFPLRARDGGVLERVGQTEGSVDLARLAGLRPAAVICEIMNEDGSMARLPELLDFGRRHHIRIVAVADVIRYRMRTERLVRRVADGQVTLQSWGPFHARMYAGVGGEGRHVALWRGDLNEAPTHVRVQRAPSAWAGLLGDAVGPVLRGALDAIASADRGVVVLMHVSGGPEWVEPAFASDFGKPERAPADPNAAMRDLGTGCQILADLGLRQLRLWTTSGRPIAGLEAYGLDVVERMTGVGT